MPDLTQPLNPSVKPETETTHGPEQSKSAKTKRTVGGAHRNTTLITHISKLASQFGEDGLNEYTLENAKVHLKPVTREFGLSPVQAVLLSQFLGRYDDTCITIGDIAGSINCTKLELLQYQDDIQTLEDKKLIHSRRGDGNISYCVPAELMEALKKGEHFKPARHRNIPLADFLEITETLFDQRNNGEITYSALGGELKDLINQNPGLPFCRTLTGYDLSDENMILLMNFCFIFAHYSNDGIWLNPIMDIFEKRSYVRKVTKTFMDGTNELLKRRLIANNIEDDDEFSASPEGITFRLTAKAKKELLGELGIKQKRKPREKRDDNGLTRYKTIKSRDLFYNAAETEQINKLAELLKGDNYQKVCKRLADSGMRTGFACLFSGGPGTGKTETAFQLARKTGRDIMKVDIPAIVGSFVGESEKNIKQQFERYRAVVKNRKTTPILLFNEADALFTKRMELGRANPTVQQMWNAMQNIILEEMENLKGILIATTNMAANLDKAFERRFLFKIEFNKPNQASRFSIWQAMLPGLSPADAETLSKSFNFSGGQIENVARKCIMENALSGRESALGELVSFCDKELMEKNSNGTIGFSIR